jgi:hypothetical protein
MLDEADPFLEKRFPKLKNGGYKVKSPRDHRYNCFAFAVNDTQHLWQYMGKGRTGGFFWIDGIDSDETLEDFIKLYRMVGFKECDDGNLEPDTVKIAIYVDRSGTPTHAARQTRRGTWKSKLGRKGKDIEHDQIELLEGNELDEYGKVAQYMKKRRYDTEDVE